MDALLGHSCPGGVPNKAQRRNRTVGSADMTKNIPISEYAKGIRLDGNGNRVPLHGEMELTFRCNNRCVHCFVNQDSRDKNEIHNELTYAEICRVIDEIVDEGCLWLILTGGEPFVRDDFFDIYHYAKQKGLLITLFTNGTLITSEIADSLKDWPPHAIEITLYGRTRETYERVTRVKDSFERCMRGIQNLLERELPLRLKTMAMTINHHELDDLKAFANELGVQFRWDPMLNARIDGDRSPVRYRLAPRDVVALDSQDAKRFSDMQYLCENFLGPYKNTDHLYGCGAGVNSFHIDPHGQLGICAISRYPRYDLRAGTFKEAWHDFALEVRTQKPRGDYQCARCDLLVLCGQCPGWSQLEHGDPEKPVEYLCEVGRLRARALGVHRKAALSGGVR